MNARSIHPILFNADHAMEAPRSSRSDTSASEPCAPRTSRTAVDNLLRELGLS